MQIRLPSAVKGRLIKVAEWAFSPDGIFTDRFHRRFARVTASAFVLLGVCWLAYAVFLYLKGLPHGTYFGFYR